MNASRPAPDRRAAPAGPARPHLLPLLALAAAGAALLAAGCGSSAGGTASTAGAATGAATNGSTLKIITRPAYAQPSPSEAARSGTAEVVYRNIAVHPQTVRVRAGTVVRWTNADPIVHNVTSDGGPEAFASGPLGQGATFAVKLTRPGIVHYRCTIHPATMNGTIEVVP